jgi:hypothetical protein
MTSQPTLAQSGITHDPVYYITVALFALLTTALPTLMGLPNLLPIIQAVTLTVFIAMPLRQHNPHGAVRTVIIWLPLQFLTITLMTVMAGGLVEQAIHDGFLYRGAISAWLYGSGPLPGALSTDPFAPLRELAGVVLGGLATAGLVGAWFLVRIVNVAAYGTGILLHTLEDGAFWRTLPYWTLLRVAGLAGLLTLSAEPLLTSQWSPAFYWQARRQMIIVAITLVVVGLLLELFLPALLTYPPIA